ncbi:MAG TPA: hypothetical protein VGT78_11630 [Rhizomicrobium sp.]|nr:hypothetical protein [Rhizomicrobium sp.]
MNYVRVALLAGMGLAGVASTALADDQPFLSLYTTDIVTAQEREIEQRVLFSAQKPGQAFASILSQTEFEYGVTDDFQLSGSANFEWEHTHLLPAPAENEREFSVSGEAIYRFLNVYFDPIGLAVYVEPSIGAHERGLEAKILLQKNFFNDNLRLALNANFEDQWQEESGGWHRGSTIELRAGAAYNLTPEWSLCAEFSNENNFDGLVGSAHPVSNLYYLGPTISYKGLPLTISLGAQAQLPWANDSTHAPGAIQNGYAADAERWRVGLLVSRDL